MEVGKIQSLAFSLLTENPGVDRHTLVTTVVDQTGAQARKVWQALTDSDFSDLTMRQGELLFPRLN